MQTAICKNSSWAWALLLNSLVFANPVMKLLLHSLSFPPNNTTFRINLERDENLAWLRRYSELCSVCKVLFWFANCSQDRICGSVWVETNCIFDISLMHCCQSNGTLNYFSSFKKNQLNHYLKLSWGIKKWNNIQRCIYVENKCDSAISIIIFLSLIKRLLKFTTLFKAAKIYDCFFFFQRISCCRFSLYFGY